MAYVDDFLKVLEQFNAQVRRDAVSLQSVSSSVKSSVVKRDELLKEISSLEAQGKELVLKAKQEAEDVKNQANAVLQNAQKKEADANDLFANAKKLNIEAEALRNGLVSQRDQLAKERKELQDKQAALKALL